MSMTDTTRIGNLFIVSGPSGAGKGTLVRAVLERVPDVWLSVSATTRAPRPGEADGVHYFFLTPAEFDREIENGGFLEWAEVHGNRYGTLRAAVEQKISEGRQVILEIDPQGAIQVKRELPGSVLVFVGAPSIEELRRRLATRGSETQDQIEVRMQTAIREIELAGTYDFVIVNDDVSGATDKIVAIMDSYANQAPDSK